MAMSFGGQKGATTAEYYGAVDRVISRVFGEYPPYFTNVDEALHHHHQSGILSSLSNPWPLATTVVFNSSHYPKQVMRVDAELLAELIPAAKAQGINVAPLQQGLQMYEQSGGKKLADLRYRLFDSHDYLGCGELHGRDCSLARLQGLKLAGREFVFHYSHKFDCCHQFAFTDPKNPEEKHQFSVAEINTFLKDVGNDRKLIPEFVKAQKQAAKMKWQDRVTSVALLGGVLGLMGLVVYKGNQHQAEKYFDPDEVVSNRATGRYLVNTERGTVADGQLPSKPGEVARVYDIDSVQQKTVTLSSAGFYQTSSFSPVTDYKKLGQVVAAWNRVQGQGEVNAARLTEIFAREAKLATELKTARAELRSAVATTP
jgi:hypothetical protein